MRWMAGLTLVACGGFTHSELEIAVHEGINRARADRGLDPLELREEISDPSREHSQDMSEGIVAFGHDGFEQRGEVIRTALPAVTGIGENVASNRGFSDPVEVAIDRWLDSDGHRANLLGDWTLTGVGVAGSEEDGWYLTQMFAD